jgi:hypothetical protein
MSEASIRAAEFSEDEEAAPTEPGSRAARVKESDDDELPPDSAWDSTRAPEDRLRHS